MSKSLASLHHSHRDVGPAHLGEQKIVGTQLWRTRNGLDGGQPDWGQQAVQPDAVRVLQVCEDAV